jgi:PPE-repeat protein
MTAALDFAMLPPEVNSGRMYSGAGSGPMLAAASAWHGLAAELRSTALSYGAVLAALTSEEWHGAASVAMAAAAAPYAAWLGTTAEQAEQAAAQAEGAAAAYEAAFAETVPPPVIAANRAQLMALIATNILGQNTPAIAATEAQYAEMWAQDAAAMYGYAASSAVATQLSQFTEPRQTTSPGGLSAQSAAVAQAIATPAGTQQSTMSQLMSALPSALQGLASPASSQTPASEIVGLLTGTGSGSATLDSLWAQWGPNANIWNTAFSSGFYMPSNTLAPFLGLLGQGAAAGDAADAAGQAVGDAIGEAVEGPAIAGVGNTVSAGIGHAPIVGALSVPPSWTAPAPLAGPLASSLGGTPMVAPPALAAGMPGMPIGATGAQPYGRAVPQYGFRPTFVARPPAAG